QIVGATGVQTEDRLDLAQEQSSDIDEGAKISISQSQGPLRQITPELGKEPLLRLIAGAQFDAQERPRGQREEAQEPDLGKATAGLLGGGLRPAGLIFGGIWSAQGAGIDNKNFEVAPAQRTESLQAAGDGQGDFKKELN